MDDWTFDKHWHFGFDASKCPPWDLAVDKPKAGIFPPPPHPSKLKSKVRWRTFEILCANLLADDATGSFNKNGEGDKLYGPGMMQYNFDAPAPILICACVIL